MEDNPALNAFNVAMIPTPPPPSSLASRLKSKNEFGLRQFNDVIGRARSTLNVIDVWKSKLVSSATRQLPSAAGSGSGSGAAQISTGHNNVFGFGSKNKNKTAVASVASPPVRTDSVTATVTSQPGTATSASAKNEISLASTAAAASRIKRRLFKRNKSLDFEAVATVSPIIIDKKSSGISATETNPSVNAVLSRSVDNLVKALGIAIGEEEGNANAGEVQCGQVAVDNKGRRRSSASITFPATDRRRHGRGNRRRCYSYHNPGEFDEVGVEGDQLEATKVSSEEEDEDEEEDENYAFSAGGDYVLNNNKLAERSHRVRESSKRSLGTDYHNRLCPVLLLDGDFDLDDFYYYYWKKKLAGEEGKGKEQKRALERDEREGTTTKKKETEQKVIRAKLKLKKLRECSLGKRRLSDSTLVLQPSQRESTARIVEELTDTTVNDEDEEEEEEESMLTEADDSSSTTTTTALSALGIPKAAARKKKLSFKEPDRKGTDDLIVNSYFRPRSGSLDSELEVLACNEIKNGSFARSSVVGWLCVLFCFTGGGGK